MTISLQKNGLLLLFVAAERHIVFRKRHDLSRVLTKTRELQRFAANAGADPFAIGEMFGRSNGAISLRTTSCLTMALTAIIPTLALISPH
ncbi:hypothetical protein D3C84_742800 [compost metagenome]